MRRGSAVRVFTYSTTRLLLLILAVGLFLRIYGLGDESLWLDEAVTVRFSNLDASRIIGLPDNNPPLYYLFLHFWIYLFGDSEYSIRLPSAVFGFFSLLIAFRMAADIFDEEVGLLSSTLLAVSPFQIYYSQEARTYSLSVLLTLLSMCFFARLQKRKGRGTLAAYVLATALLLYSHFYGLFIVVSQNLFFLSSFLFSRRSQQGIRLGRWGMAQLAVFLLFLPWIQVVWQRIQAVQRGWWIATPSLHSILSSLKEFAGCEILMWLFLGISVFSFLGIRKISGKTDWRDLPGSLQGYRWNVRLIDLQEVCLLLLWLIVPLALPFLISQFSAPIYLTRYAIVASPAFCMVTAKGLREIDLKYARIPAIVVFIVGSLILANEYYAEPSKEQWREAAAYVDENAETGELLVFHAGYCQEPFDYYSKRPHLKRIRFPVDGRDFGEEDLEELLEKAQHYRRVWLVVCHSGDRQGMIKPGFSRLFHIAKHTRFKGIDTYFLDRKQAP
jgi:uncharacterized membrane protein